MSQIAQTIADQIGHQAFVMMGTNRKFSDGDALIFNVRGSKTTNKIKITLTPMDVYTVEFFKIGRAPLHKITRHEETDVYAEDLRSTIERYTGLYLSLGTMGGKIFQN